MRPQLVCKISNKIRLLYEIPITFKFIVVHPLNMDNKVLKNLWSAQIDCDESMT